MRILGVGGQSGPASATRRAPNEAHAPDQPETGSRALIALQAAAASEGAPRVTRHPAAGFLAQLIATQMQAPQTRARRRADPERRWRSTGR